ncbi:MAG: Hsp20/alpha crystallin family protein [Chloroflexi bacterium]|nr:Hsp20/alpha crystallin family protein [Ktedonobacteraceae bacterium]MBV8822060.1 Hsp20/alpha crystallin family protein [Ktedonobacteraceae bacterium]MBV9019195.1 Hsp20/alpha crystallin family protein [Ktedonobacteraceae bacterium]MBV9706870.1 Hsp20/alpha crystallin family protein [Chloroflexota bacterium]
MQESVKVQNIPVKMYRTAERLTVAAPMPGLLPEDIVVEVTSGNHLLLRGELRGVLKDIKELLVDEWSVGGYYRELALPDRVNAEHANVTYRNGVVVVALPISERTIPAILTLKTVGLDHGEYAGNAGHAQI